MGSQQKQKMVIKTETCSYSGFKIWPGHGRTYVRIDHKQFKFVDKKARACLLMKRRNLTTKWTAHYRRINKKGISADEAKKRRSGKKTTTVRRDIAGLQMRLSSRPALHAQPRRALLSLPTRRNLLAARVPRSKHTSVLSRIGLL